MNLNRLERIAQFWREAPALLLGCNLLVAAAAALHPHPSYLFAYLVLWTTFIIERNWKSLFAYIALCSLLFLFVSNFYNLPPSNTQKVRGTGYFEIESVRASQSPFSRSFLYQGTLRSFEADSGEKWKNIPCSLHLPYNKARVKAGSDYLVEGYLSKKGSNYFVLKTAKRSSWQAVSNTFSFAEWRYQAKEWTRSFLKKEISNPRVAAFFIALTVGDLDDRLLSMEFAKVGLQHILGISGFHFVLFAAFLGLILRAFLPFRPAAIILLVLLTFYFFFVGSAPATFRGWVAISVFLAARLLHFNTSALNALGVGLACEILYNPLCILNIGFQLSFLCTWAILMVYPLFKSVSSYILPRRTLQQVVQMNALHQHGHLLSSLIREALSLNFAVHFASLPLILFLFHKFPFQSIVYNLFFPFLFSGSLLLLLISTLFTFLIPPLGKLFHAFNTHFTGTLLEIVSRAPPALDMTLRIRDFPFSLLILFLSSLLLLTILFRPAPRQS